MMMNSRISSTNEHQEGFPSTSENSGGVNGTVAASAAASSSSITTTTPKSGKIEDRLFKAVEASSCGCKHRSPELIPLTADYEQMKKKLRNLINAIKKYQKQTQLMQESKFELVEQFAKLSERSPIYNEVGSNLDDDETTEALTRIIRRQQQQQPPPSHQQQNDTNVENNNLMPKTSIVAQIAEEYQQKMNTIMNSSNTNELSSSDNHHNQRKKNAVITSLYGLYHFGAAQAVANDYEYQIHIVEYVTEWERIVTERVEKELKSIRTLETDRRHYERKVDTLRQKYNDLQSKNKPCPKSQIDKLQRNEDKLKEAFTIHEREAGKVCALLEAITHEGYMDLYPLVKNYMKWEMNRIGREHDIATQMTSTLDSMTEKCGSSKKKKKSPR